MIPPDIAPWLPATCKANPGLEQKVRNLSLRQDAIAMNCYGTAALAGNPRTLEEVQAILAPVFRHDMLLLIRDHLAEARQKR